MEGDRERPTEANLSRPLVLLEKFYDLKWMPDRERKSLLSNEGCVDSSCSLDGNVEADRGFSESGRSVTGDRVGLSANGFTATS